VTDHAEPEATLAPEILDLEELLSTDPESEELHMDLLFAYGADEKLHGHPGRIEQILWHVQSVPWSPITRSPLTRIDPEVSPDGHALIERAWLENRELEPNDEEIVSGYAAFLAGSYPLRAFAVLDEFVATAPDHAELWVDMGLIHPEPKQSLRCFEEAKKRGSTQENLLTWTGEAALRAGDLPSAEAVGRSLSARIAAARALHGERLDWPERGRALFEKAQAVADNTADAEALLQAIATHAYDKHWAHTLLGMVAAHGGDESAAIRHLAESAAVVAEERLSTHGPSLLLAAELSARGFFDRVAAYLEVCRVFWQHDMIDVWLSELAQRRTPVSWMEPSGI
jgi:hypothetical protein